MMATKVISWHNNKLLALKVLCMKCMEWQPENKIDKRLSRLIDPEQPLRDSDVFLPSVDFSIIELLWLGFWLLIFVVGALAASNELLAKFSFVHNQESKGLPIIISILMLIGSCFASYKIWGSLNSRLTQRKMWKNGRYRNGMFILNDAILLHSMQQIFFVEKKYIRGFHIVHKGRGEEPHLLMIMQKDKEEPINVNLHTFQLEHNAYTLKKTLIHWINTGRWEIQTALSEFNMPEITNN